MESRTRVARITIPRLGGEETLMSHLLTARELAAVLQVNEKDLYRKAVLGELPSYKIGKSRRFDLDDVLAACREEHATCHARTGVRRSL